MKKFSQIQESKEFNIGSHIDHTLAQIEKSRQHFKGDHSMQKMFDGDRDSWHAMKWDVEHGDHAGAARTFSNMETGCRDHGFNHSKHAHAGFREYLKKHGSHWH